MSVCRFYVKFSLVIFNFPVCQNVLESSLRSKRDVQRGLTAKSLASLKWNPTVCLSCPSLPAAAEDYLILSERPVCGLWSLLSALKRGRGRGGRWREGEMGDGLHSITLRGRPHGHHHQAAPDSSYHAWAALWRAAAGLVGGGGGLRRGSSRGEKRAPSAELIVL